MCRFKQCTARWIEGEKLSPLISRSSLSRFFVVKVFHVPLQSLASVTCLSNTCAQHELNVFVSVWTIRGRRSSVIFLSLTARICFCRSFDTMAIPSLMQNSFTDVYDEFLFGCSHGDCLSVERLLRTSAIRPTDISKPMGEGKLLPIVLAIEHNHAEVLKILLNHLPYDDFREALLLAIYLDLTNIAQLIMEHDTFKCFYGTFADWQIDTVDSHDESHFAAIRPIQLAAQCNRTTILYEFLKRGKQRVLSFDGTYVDQRCSIQVNVSKCLIVFNVNVTRVHRLVSPIVCVILNCVSRPTVHLLQMCISLSSLTIQLRMPFSWVPISLS